MNVVYFRGKELKIYEEKYGGYLFISKEDLSDITEIEGLKNLKDLDVLRL